MAKDLDLSEFGGTPQLDLSEFDQPAPAPASAARRAADTGLALGRSIVAAPETAVGLSNIVTGGRTGKAVERLGVRFKDAKQVLTDFQSDEQKAADAKVQAADGFLPTVGAMVENPSTIANALAESVPLMLAGGAVSRGLVNRGMGAITAGAVGEGVVSAGSAAEQIRQEGATGFLTPKQAALAATSGAATGVIGRASGKLADKLGIADVNTTLATGKLGGGTERGILRNTAYGAVNEGVLQELPQSMQEQALQNLALDKPVGEGVAEAGAAGMLVGGLTGGGFGAVSRSPQSPSIETDSPDVGAVNPQVAAPGVSPSVQGGGIAPPQEPAKPPPSPPAPPPSKAQAMGINPAAGPLQAAAGVTVDTGADVITQDQEVQKQKAEAAAKEKAKPGADGKKPEPEAPPPVQPVTPDPAAPVTGPFTKAIHGASNATPTPAPAVNPQGPVATQGAGAAVDSAAAPGVGADQGPQGPGAVPDAVPEPAAAVTPVATPPTQESTNATQQAIPGESIDPETGEITQSGPQGAGSDGGQRPADALQPGADAEGPQPAPDQPAAPAAASAPPEGKPPAPTEPVSDDTPKARWLKNIADGQRMAGSTGVQIGGLVNGRVNFLGDPRATKQARSLAGAVDEAIKAGATPQEIVDAALKPAPAATPKPPAPTTPVDMGAHTAATSPHNGLPEPTQAQKEAGNYKKAHLVISGVGISVENPEGSTRSGTDKDGKAWSNTMQWHYGYAKRTVGSDDEQQDVFVKPGTPLDYAGPVFVVDQIDPKTGKHDEYKSMLGAKSPMEARKAYMDHYAKDWKGLKNVTALTWDQWREWLQAPKGTAPVASTGQPSPSEPRASDPSPAPETPARTETAGASPPSQVELLGPQTVDQTASDPASAPQPAEGPAASARESGVSQERSPSPDGTPDKPAKPPSKPTGGKNLRAAAYEKNPLLTFLAQHGLFHDKDKPGSQKAEFSPDKQVMVMGYGPVFRKAGMKPDLLVARAIEDGYLPQDGSELQLVDLIRRAIGGERIAPMFTEGAAETEMQKRMQAVDDLRELDDNEVSDLDPDIFAESNVSTEDAMRALGFTEQEIHDATTQGPRAPQEGRQGGGEPDETEAAGPGEGAQGGPRAPPAAVEPEGLTAPTRADVIAQQDRVENAQALDDREQIDREAGAQTLTAQTAPEQRKDNTGDMFAVEKAQATIDKRNASGTRSEGPSLFDEPAEPEQAAITRDEAGNMSRGDIVRDSKGVEYYAWSARFGRIEVMPMQDGKPVVNNASAIRFALDDATRAANPEYRTDPLYLVRKAPAESEPTDEPDRNGLRAADRYARDLASAAQELASQIYGDFNEADFDPAEVLPGLQVFAKDAGVPADELRQAVLKNLRASTMSLANLRKVEKALDPTKAPVETAAPATAAHKVGDLVKLTKPGVNGRVNIAGTITKILPDGRLEIRTQQDGYMTVAPSELGHKPTAAPATTATSRSRPRDTITFKTPIKGPSGSSLVSYTWQWMPMDVVDARGEDRTVRVSDWDKADTNAETGREIVHQFVVAAPDGSTQTVSAETAVRLLGFGGDEAAPFKSATSAAKTLARLRMQAYELDTLMEQFTKDHDAVKAMRTPAPTSERNAEGWFEMGDAKVRQLEPGAMLPERLRTLTSAWRDNRLQERGWKSGEATKDLLGSQVADIGQRIKRAEKKIASLGDGARPATQATTILDAANVTGKDRLDILKDVKSGALTPDEVQAAFPGVEPATPAPKPGEVENFGETLPPARRNMAAKLDEELTDSDIANRPLSEIWPLAENQAIEDTFAAAVAHAARAEVPSKPRVAYKLKQWVQKVKTVRQLAAMIVSGRFTREQFIAKAPSTLKDWLTKVMLLEQIPRDQWNRVEAVEERPDSFGYKDSKQVKMPHLSIRIDGKSHWLTGDAGIDGDVRGTLNGNRAGIMALLSAAEPEERMQFEVRQRRGGKVFINKKGDSEYRALMEFDTAEDARKAITSQYDDLVAAWEATKARDNITERDLRSAENRPRAGKDHRGGRDVTPEEFQSKFGFRGGEFGKWVKQGKGDKERQAILNSAYDALMDLADIAGIPPKAISLNGTLGIAFGSRGSGWASAHFEPGNLVMNLTKTRGAGALAHEWFHALDNYFSRMRRGGAEAPFTGDQNEYRSNNYITHRPEPMMVPKNVLGGRYLAPMTMGKLQAMHEARKDKTDAYNPDNWQRDPKTPEGVRPEVEARFAALVDALNQSPMTKRARTLDGVKSGEGYWSRTLERAARSFESYVIAKMHEEGYHNDFLVNVKKSDETGKAGDRYPYLMAGEVKPIAEAFDALFDTMETVEDDAGNVAIREPDAPYETDLFGQAVPAPIGRSAPARPARAGVRGNVQPAAGVQDTPAPQGEYFASTLVGSEVSRELGASRITKPEHAAQATTYLYKSAVERLDGIVTDKNGKPLGIVGGFKGALSQASVYPATLVTEAVRIPGAAHIWFSHNHPSGNPQLSRADEMLNQTLSDVFRGSGIEPMGLLAIGNGRFSFVGQNSVDRVGDTIPGATTKISVPVIERTLGASGARGPTLSNPADAKQHAKDFYAKAKKPGLMLMDAQNTVIAWVPITDVMMGELRGTGGLNSIYRAISQANAGAAIIVHGGELSYQALPKNFPRVTPSENIAAALAKIDVRPLDSIDVTTSRSAAESTGKVAHGPVFSRKWQGPFYSALTKELESVNAGAQPALGWASTINGLVKAGKVKQDEVEWSGVMDFLRLQTGKVSKASVVQFLDANGVRVEETVLGETGLNVDGNLEVGQNNDGEFAVFTEDGSAVGGTYRTEAEANDALDSMLADAPTKYGTYQLPGGTNYREVLLTLPAKEGRAWVDRAGNVRQWIDGEPTAEVRSAMEASGLTLKSLPLTDAAGTFKSSHWDQPNVLAHIRVNDRVDADGKRVLFVEELQSDFAQEGRKRGFREPFDDKATPSITAKTMTAREFVEERSMPAAAAQFWLDGRNDIRRDLGEAPMTMDDMVTVVYEGDTPKVVKDGAIPADKAKAAYERGTQRIAQERRALHEQNQANKLPRAPFVERTDAWLSLALKRIVKMAVDEGYDRVAFVNGDQSAERYDLSKQVETLSVSKDGDGFKVSFTAVYGGIQPVQRAKNASDLEAMIGKELAAKAVKDLADRPRSMAVYTGLDLKVGGEGMKAFYDKIVPNTLKDVLRKVGGGALETVDVSKGEIMDHASRTGYRKVWYKAQPGFTITDAMQERAANGLPLFDRKAPASTGMPAQKVRLMAAPIAKRLHIDLRVVDTPAGLPIPAPSDAVGLYHNGTIWIVASNVKTRQDIMQAVAHEAVAHLGLRQLLEPAEYRKLMTMINAGAASNGKLAEAKAWVRRAYVDRSGKFNLTPIQEADEIAARVAELGVDVDGNFRPGFEWLKDIFARVVQWLRSKGMDVPFTNAELQGMLVRAQTLLERGPDAAGQMGTAFSLSGSRADVRRMNEKQIALEIRVLMPRVEIAYAKGNMALAERLDARLETLMDAMEANLLEMQEDTLDMAYDGFNRAVLEKEGQEGDIEADVVIDLANRWLQITKPGSFESKEFSTDAERAATLRALLSDYEHRHGGLKEGLSDETIIEAAKDAVASVYGLREARHARAQARQGLTPYRPDDMTPEQIQAQMAAMADAGDAAAAATRAEQEAARAMADGETPIPDWMRATQFMRRPDMAAAAKTAGNTAAHYRGLGLQALGRRQITELYGDILPQLPIYNRLMAQMDADKNEAGAEADQIAQDWGKLKDERQLAELMHDATLAQMDPEKPLMRGDDPLTYDRLREKFVALSPEARKVYVDARETYRNHHENVRKAIRDRIERSELRGQRKAELLQQMDQEFYQAIKGVYFPLARFGDYVVIVRDITGKAVSVNRAETINEAEALQAELRRAYPEMTVGKVLKSKEFNAGRDAVGRGFMQNLYEALGKSDMDEKQRADLEDMLGQLYLSALPDLSWAKHGIHRKGTPGFSQDARRAFAQNTFHGARYLSKVRYSDLLENELIDAQKQVDSMSESESFESIKAQQVIDEMVKRHDAAMNPESNALSTALTSLGFVFHLGLSPASAMVNLTQTALVAYPIMGAKWGFDKAAAALLKASQQAAANRNDISAALSPEEKMAYDEAVRSGVIDVTMAHDLAGISQGEDAKVSWKLRPVMRWASFLFHHAEKFNRQATFVAAYRLAREAGSNPVQAYEQATKATYDGHFDYSATNRPRLMQGNAARVILLFKQYGQNMVYTLSRQAYLSMKGKNQFERAQARKALGGLLAMHAAAAGALGLPMVSTLLAAASMLGSDDDEPWDAEVALRNMLADALGDQAADVLARGLSRLTPWDISGRVALDKLILPDIQEGLEGQRLGESAMAAALGPVAGIGISLLRGMQEISEGNFAKGLETMAPAFARGPLRAIRYQAEGAIDKTGKPIVEDVSAAGVLGQALGFSPSEVRLATEAKSAVHQADAKLTQRRSILMRQYSLAVIAGDEEGAADAREDILAFNEKNPGRRINPLQMARSVATRRKQIAESQGGVYLPKNRRDAMEAGQFGM